MELFSREAEERVWVVPRNRLLEALGGPMSQLWTGELEPVLGLIEAEGLFRRRTEAEVDESHLQIIPYVCLRRDRELFAVTRLTKQGEARLHGRMSLGIGGHLNPEDGTPPFWPGLKRELLEEMSVTLDDGELRPIGVILDDSTAVGRVHCGIAFLLEVNPGIAVEIRETDKMLGTWHSLSAVESAEERLETWSAWLLPWLRADQEVSLATYPRTPSK